MYRLIYTFIYFLILPLYFLRLLVKGVKNPDYLYRWNERLGFGRLKPSGEKKVLWVHAVSVGEVNASIPLIRSILKKYEDSEVLVTTTTPTGSKILMDKLGSRIKHQYLPIDLPIFLNRFLRIWNPRALILLETEIWPNLIAMCKKKDIFVSLVNARLSERSLKKYLRFKDVISESISDLDLIIAQYKTDQKRFRQLVPRKKINLCGNLKFDQEIPDQFLEISNSIKEGWSINEKMRPTLIGASTHEGEEEALLDGFIKIKQELDNPLLILVPRHPERFNRVKQIIRSYNLSISVRSIKEEVQNDTDVLLGDTMGELNFLYSLSDVAFVGGSLINHGGQNLLEPAALSLPIISGPNLRNFEEIAKKLKNQGALEIVKGPKDIQEVFSKLISDKRELNKRKKASRLVYEENRGAVDRILNDLDNPLQMLLS